MTTEEQLVGRMDALRDALRNAEVPAGAEMRMAVMAMGKLLLAAGRTEDGLYIDGFDEDGNCIIPECEPCSGGLIPV